ncbi:MAG: hypothetical protein OXF44_08650 [Anaerolineaceae bacterium]|nr:hypothetical protein [Anaerolineaceae bacterium]MCY4023825.1 hypothetical protein [Anaerolineaceae bacterium]
MPKTGPTRIVFILALVAVLLCLTLAISYRLIRPGLTAFNAARQSALYLADGLRRTSDDLTRMARLYAITGDPDYRKWFDEILDIRNGLAPRPDRYFDVPYWDLVLVSREHSGEEGEPVAIRTLVQEAGLYEAEIAELERAEDESNALAVIENEIMDVIAGQVEAGDGEYALEGEALAAALRLYGPEYHAAKARVMEPLVELDRKVGEATAEANVGFRINYDRIMYSCIALMTLAFVLVAFGEWQRSRR